MMEYYFKLNFKIKNKKSIVNNKNYQKQKNIRFFNIGKDWNNLKQPLKKKMIYKKRLI